MKMILRHSATSIVFVVALVLNIVACSSQVQEDFTPVPQPTVEYLWNHPIATPQFVMSVTTDAGRSGFEQDICANIREGAIWEKGEFGSDVYNRIQKSTTARFDGKVMGNLVFYQSTVNIDEFNSQKQVIGSHGGGVSVCFNIPVT
jgi:hypothetical protein